jgi:YfiH family protein
MIKEESHGLVIYQFEKLLPYELTQAVFTRHGGVSHHPWHSLNLGGTVGDDPVNVAENLSRILTFTGYQRKDLVQVHQVHSADVILAEGPVPGGIKGDAIITNKPGLLLLMRFADCVPLFFYDPLQQAAGIAHAGWMGTVRDVAGETVRAMAKHYRSDPSGIKVGIGPSIGPDHYPVGMDVVHEIKRAFPGDWNSLLTDTVDGVQLDLWKANRISLEKAGVEEIESSEICTACHVEDWYSHRAENGQTGRFAAVIGIKGSL